MGVRILLEVTVCWSDIRRPHHARDVYEFVALIELQALSPWHEQVPLA